GSISGVVYQDLNNSGHRDLLPTAEPGLNDWPVGIDDPLCSCSRLVRTPNTGDLGTYTISGLTAGVQYRVYTLSSTAWAQTQPADPLGYTIVLPLSGSSIGNDFGEKQVSFNVPALTASARWLLAFLLLGLGFTQLARRPIQKPHPRG